MLPGSVELGERVLGLPTKVGYPIVTGGLVETVKSPIFATSVGLIKYAMARQTESSIKRKSSGGIKNIFGKIKDQFEDLF